MKKRYPALAGILCLALVLGPAAFSVEQAPAQARKLPGPAPMFAADLQIQWIAAAPCGCEAEAPAVDAIILAGPVTVRVHNAGPRAADAEVNIAAMLHRFGSVVPQSPQKVHLEKDQSASLVFFPTRSAQNPLLICRSKGIKAEVKLTSGGVDPNPSNNTMTIHGCQPIVE